MNSPATGKPTISGTARVGRILTADRGTVDDANGVPDVFDYQWIRVEGMGGPRRTSPARTRRPTG